MSSQPSQQSSAKAAEAAAEAAAAANLPPPPPQYSEFAAQEHAQEQYSQQYSHLYAPPPAQAPPPSAYGAAPPSYEPAPAPTSYSYTPTTSTGFAFPPGHATGATSGTGAGTGHAVGTATSAWAGHASGKHSASPSTSSSHSEKPGIRDRFYQWTVKASVPINKLTNKLGSEAFWPSSLDHECNKAARILQSFCRDGFYTGAPESAPGGPKGKAARALVKIPPEVIRSAVGLAIFTTFRTGLHISGAGGSGLVVARLPDGGWSPPSGVLVHTLGAGFLVGLDIYDCVCVLRTPAALEAFTRPRVSLGGEIGLVAGPVGAGGALEAALACNTSPVLSYIKSRGFYAGVQADGTIILGRPDANADFYGRRGISVADILNGRVPPPAEPGTGWPLATRCLMEVLKAAEGRTDVDPVMMQQASAGPTPGDLGMHDTDKEVYVPPPSTTAM